MTMAAMMATATKRGHPRSSAATFFFQTIVMLVMLVSQLDVGRVEGYASWLKCFIEFDPDEIVMHQNIVPAHEASEKVTIEVQPYFLSTDDNAENDATETSHPVASPTSVEDEIAKDGTWISTDEYFIPQQQEEEGDNKGNRRTSTTLKVRLRVPPSLQHEDVQWVVEAMTAKESGLDASPSSSAQFIDVGVMCDGNRAFSRQQSEHVVLNIEHGDDDDDDDISLVAGWASGYSAVTLTPKMVLKKRRASSSPSTAYGDNPDVQNEL